MALMWLLLDMETLFIRDTAQDKHNRRPCIPRGYESGCSSTCASEIPISFPDVFQNMQPYVQQLSRNADLPCLQALAKLKPDVSSTVETLSSSCSASPVATSLFLQMTAHQKQITNTAALDGALKALGTVHASLVQRLHKEASAAAGEFLEGGGGVLGPSGEIVGSKVLKLGDDCMKRLRNGDIYRVSYMIVGSRLLKQECFIVPGL